VKRSQAIEPLVCVVLVLLFYHPLLNPGAMPSGGDAANLFWPLKLIMYRSIWGDGIVPLWNPYSYLGAPLAASLQHAVFYPVDWLIYTILPAHVGINVGNLFHLSLAAVGGWLLLRRGLDLAAIPSIAAAAAFPCGAWFWGQLEHINQVAAVCWLPLLAALSVLFVRGAIAPSRYILLYSAAMAIQFMSGHPQEFFYAHLFSFAVILSGSLLFPASCPPFVRRVVTLGASLLIAGLLIGVQLLMTMEASSHSRRQFRDPTYALSFSMPPAMLATYVAPHFFGSFRDGYFKHNADGGMRLNPAGEPEWSFRAYGEYGLFVGVPVLLLAVGGFWSRQHRRVVVFLAIVGAVALLLALGGNTAPARLFSRDFTEFPQPGWSLHELFLTVCPPAAGFRVPARIAVLTGFSLALLGGIGFDALLRQQALAKSRTVVGVAIAAAILAALYIPSRREKFHYPASMTEVAALAHHDLGQSRRSLDGHIYRLTVGDDGRLVAERHLESTFAGGNPILNRYLGLQPHMNVIPGLPNVDGYEEGLVPTARFKDFLYEFNRNLRQFRPDPTLLNLLDVREILSEGIPVDPELYRPDGHTEGGWLRHLNSSARGAAFWRDRTAGVDLARLDGPFWRGGQPHPEINRTAIDLGTLTDWSAPDLLMTTHLPTLNSVEVRISHQPIPVVPSSNEALLVLGWYPGWRFAEGAAIRNGSPPVEWANAIHARLPMDALTMQELSAGDHQASWLLEFRPFSYRLGLYLSMVGIALWAALAGWRWRQPPLTAPRPSH